MTGVHGGDPPVKGSAGRRIALAAASGIDRLITRLCRFIVLVTGIALTVILTGNVVARYVLASGGIDAAQELPETFVSMVHRRGIALAAQAGGHMSVDGDPGKRFLRGYNHWWSTAGAYPVLDGGREQYALSSNNRGGASWQKK